MEKRPPRWADLHLPPPPTTAQLVILGRWDLGELLAKYGVPGAQVAVLAGGEIRDEAAGVLSLRTGAEALDRFR
jgi:hypothetical protein